MCCFSYGTALRHLSQQDSLEGEQGKQTRARWVRNGGVGLAKPIHEKPEQMSIYAAHMNLRAKDPVRVGLWFTAAGERRL